jgi:competence protein ComEA
VVPAVGEPLPAGSYSPGGEIVSAEGIVNINTASAEELQTLPGIGETIAGYIIEYREEHGGFKSIEEITNVSRIGTVTFNKIKDRITV